MPYALQSLRALMAEHPDRTARLAVHVDALERSIEYQPAFCLQNVRTLFEAAHVTIAPHLKVEFKNIQFPGRMKAIIDALDFSIADHPNGDQISAQIAALLTGIEDTALALSRLSNIPNMRHGGSLDWGTLERQHAAMLGGLCDALVSFLFDVAWSRPVAEAAVSEPARYEDFEAFNAYLDDEHGDVEIAGAAFPASRVLYLMDTTQYDAARIDWEGEQTADAGGADVAA